MTRLRLKESIGMLLVRFCMLTKCLLVTGIRAGASLSAIHQKSVSFSVVQLKKSAVEKENHLQVLQSCDRQLTLGLYVRFCFFCNKALTFDKSTRKMKLFKKKKSEERGIPTLISIIQGRQRCENRRFGSSVYQRAVFRYADQLTVTLIAKHFQ